MLLFPSIPLARMIYNSPLKTRMIKNHQSIQEYPFTKLIHDLDKIKLKCYNCLLLS
uniref:Uncharacterized protein n=1 Tax=Rhizophora mucronata TaxID=61149 RepID=A0A2P2PEZ2_RHIMU